MASSLGASTSELINGRCVETVGEPDPRITRLYAHRALAAVVSLLVLILLAYKCRSSARLPLPRAWLCAMAAKLALAARRAAAASALPRRLPAGPRPRAAPLARASPSGGAPEGLPAAVAALRAEQREQLEAFVATLVEWGAHTNLTRERDREGILERHVADSLALLPALDAAVADAAVAEGGRPRLVDVGSGPGLPGLVLAIARPQWDVTCVDARRKRVTFMREACARAGVGNATPQWARAEEAGAAGSAQREAFDVATCRALADTALLAELCLPLVRVGGVLVAAKGPEPHAEVAGAAAALEKLGGDVGTMRVEQVDSRGPAGMRTVLVVGKGRATPAGLPRTAAAMKKKTL